MKRFKDLHPGDTVWKLLTQPNNIKLDKFVVEEALPVSINLFRFMVKLKGREGIMMTIETSQDCFVQLDLEISYYCDEPALLQRIEDEEDLITSQLLATDGWASTYNSIEQMFAEVYETI